MAINNTGAMFKSFEFDGTDSRNFGVYITGAAVYNAPEREVEMISIPNRNGAFALDKGRFENVEVTYPAGIYADTESDFAEGISDLRNFLCSKRGYCRLTDEYNPNEYRMAIYKSGLEVEPSLLKAGEFEITFECMPQRYLNSGDEEIEVGEWGETETKTGDIVTIDNTDGLMAVKSLNVSLLPKQDGTPTQDSTVYNEPYLSKTSPSFNSEYDKLIGGTVAWNQLIDTSVLTATKTVNGITITNNNDGTLSFSGTATSTIVTSVAKFNAVVNHIYYAPAGAPLKLYDGYVADGIYIIKARQTLSAQDLYALIDNGTTMDMTAPINITDLTQMFGTTIADYVYSLEQSTAGSGIAWLKSYGFFTEDYYEYNAGELMSTKPTAHVTSQTYPLAGVELRGIPKLDTNKLYYDGDEYESSGTVTRKYGIVDLGSLTWNKEVVGGVNNFYTQPITDAHQTAKVLCSKRYVTNGNISVVDGNIFISSSKRVNISDNSYSDAATFQTSMSGIYLIYDKATPTTETVTGFTSPQEVGTTESYTDNRVVPIPVGHESTYANIYPITGYDNTIFTDSNGTDTTTTTVTLPHTVYGADVDVTGGDGQENMGYVDLGSLSWGYYGGLFNAVIPNFAPPTAYLDRKTGFITSIYPADTQIVIDSVSMTDKTALRLSGGIYIKDTSYTDVTTFRNSVTGQGICFELATPTDLTTTPTDVELLTGVNNISSPQGETTIEYGQNPNIIINPTLFDAEPMLEVYGYGTINIGSKTVTLYDQPVGDIVVAEQAKNSFSTTTVEIDDTYANLGDEITFERIFVQTDSRAPNNQYIYTPNITASGTDVTVSADVEVNGRQLLTTITLDSDSSLVFAYGTSKSVSAVANSSFTVHGSTVTSTTTIGLSYDGDKTFTLLRSVTFSQAGYGLLMNNTFNLLGPTHLNSTQNLLGNPTYIDLSIGEAYRIDGDSAASLNNAVVLPIELPTLPKGETEITFDNTITRLDIVPRWWKI